MAARSAGHFLTGFAAAVALAGHLLAAPQAGKQTDAANLVAAAAQAEIRALQQVTRDAGRALRPERAQQLPERAILLGLLTGAQHRRQPCHRRLGIDSRARESLHTAQQKGLRPKRHPQLAQQRQHRAQVPDDEARAPHADRLEPIPGHRQDLCVRGRAFTANSLDTDLGELPVPDALR